MKRTYVSGHSRELPDGREAHVKGHYRTIEPPGEYDQTAVQARDGIARMRDEQSSEWPDENEATYALATLLAAREVSRSSDSVVLTDEEWNLVYDVIVSGGPGGSESEIWTLGWVE